MTDHGHAHSHTINSESDFFEAGDFIYSDANSYVPQQFTNQHEEKVRRDLKYFFMNPIQKWKAKRKFPFKLCLLIFGTLLVALNLILYGNQSHEFQVQRLDSEVSFRHIFLKDWDPERDVANYPPSTGIYAAYTVDEFYDNLNFVIKQYSKFTKFNIGSYGYDNDNNTIQDLHFCLHRYKHAYLNPSLAIIDIDDTEIIKCIIIEPQFVANSPEWNNFTFKDVLQEHNISVNFDELVRATLSFKIRAIFMRAPRKLESIDCFKINISIHYDNSLHESQIQISLNTKSQKLQCNLKKGTHANYVYNYRQYLDMFVIIVCSLCFLLCSRSIYRGQVLRVSTQHFFKAYRKQELQFHDKHKFLDKWYVMIILQNLLIIVGTAIKIQIENKAIEGDQYNNCAMLLGVGNLLGFAGLLRYLEFFEKYNIIMCTIKRALPNCLRFLLCTMLLYGGFTICGWLVLGPYHIKFMTLSTASECLFAMMNGDDLYATYAILDTNSESVWWFSRVYLYTFIALFIYIVISLFIAVIMDAYDYIKNERDTASLTILEKFINEVNAIPYESYRSDSQPRGSCMEWLRNRFARFRQGYQEID